MEIQRRVAMKYSGRFHREEERMGRTQTNAQCFSSTGAMGNLAVPFFIMRNTLVTARCLAALTLGYQMTAPGYSGNQNTPHSPKYLLGCHTALGWEPC